MKRKKERRKRKFNPLTCESHIFINWTFKLDPMPLHMVEIQ